MIYAVIRKSDQVEVYRYAHAERIEWQGMEFATHDHVEVAEAVAPPAHLEPPEDWFIGVGPFYDRFGAYKLPILASTDPLVQAIIKDSSVRKYLDLKGRRSGLLQVVGLLQSKGFAVSAEALLDVKPSAQEIHRAN